ncbi:K02A2.6-like [Cordylochernes scorpioides]|uniref:K02A2.6-like n=1 Tax=Cordylochernes scorpioides TaxID=51811 RepID=A0ABY6KK54_9ARAC|nr:K02A2.6-like [Cordylochernes scorpioides]
MKSKTDIFSNATASRVIAASGAAARAPDEKSTTRTHLNLLQLNINGTQRKTEELTCLLRDKNVHIACFQETKLNQNLRFNIKELVLACDSSSYGLGVILSHKNDRKEECPIAFASRTKTEAEKRYSQLEKEALSIRGLGGYGVEKSRQYLLGRKFVLVTDNRPLIHIFSPQKPIPICAASRIKRLSLKLAAFNYTEEFRKSSDNYNVDALSRLPLESSVRESLDEDQVLLLRKLNEVPFSFREVAYETSRDKMLSILLRNVREGNWKFTRVLRENPLAPYYKINEELSLEFGCLQWRERVVIPQKLISLILNYLHEMHMGIVKMKMIAKRYFLSKNYGKDYLETNLQRFLFAHGAFPQTVIKEFPRGTANEEKFEINILEFNTKIGNPREVFNEAVRRQKHFTTGCEVYFRNYATGPKRTYIKIKEGAGQISSNFTCELTAIWKALDVCLNQPSLHQAEGILIYSYSISALEAIQKGNTIITQKIHSLLTQLESLENNCILQWIPARVGIGDNEMAVELAKEAKRIISGVEASIKDLGHQAKSDIRSRISSVLMNPTTRNRQARMERTIMKRLKDRSDIIICNSDKGSQTVVMDISMYRSKMMDVLTDESTFIPIDEDTRLRTYQDFRKALLAQKILSQINSEECKLFTSRLTTDAYIYGLPKIHKPNVPLRPIVACHKSPSAPLARYLSNFFSPLLKQYNHRFTVHNTPSFIEELWKTSPGYPTSFFCQHFYDSSGIRNTAHYLSTCFIPYSHKSAAIARVLNRYGVNSYFSNTLSLATKLKQSIVKNSVTFDSLSTHNAIYSISCEQCDAKYVGETGRMVKTRMVEHDRSVKRKDPHSLVYQHIRDTGHTFNVYNPSAHYHEIKNKHQRLVLEAILTKKSALSNVRDSAEFWKIIASFKKRNSTKGNIDISEWESFYQGLLSPPQRIVADIPTLLIPIDSELDAEISPLEIAREIASLKNNKAAGYDSIPNEAIKDLPENGLILLSNLFNKILTKSQVPSQWSKTIIQPIFKNGDPNAPSNYRGIALISNLSKLFTSILKNRLSNWIENRKLIAENQAGFRRGYSCQDHIFTLTSLIQMTLNRKRRKLYAFFVDLKKRLIRFHIYYYGESLRLLV